MPDSPIADLVLASASPRRRELLEQLGLTWTSRRPTSTRRPRPGERPADYVKRVAAAKCDAIAQARGRPISPILAADTIVIVDDAILGQAGRRGGRAPDVAARWPAAGTM